MPGTIEIIAVGDGSGGYQWERSCRRELELRSRDSYAGTGIASEGLGSGIDFRVDDRTGLWISSFDTTVHGSAVCGIQLWDLGGL